MNLLTHITWGLLCSFFGTLPFGTVNMSITEASIQRGVRVGIFMGAGAALVEFIQAYIGLAFFHLLSSDPKMERTIVMVCIPIFFTIGLYYLLKKNSLIPQPSTKAAHAIGFAKGVVLGSFNLLIIPYYVFLGGLLASSGHINLHPDNIAFFAAGVAFGSFLAFYLYARLGVLIRKKSDRLSRYASKIVGLIFIAIAISQAIRYYKEILALGF
ncbi:MAG TPA: LysE family transporter [Cyclobacteriaceae bacterium]|nr:LysE family transporter [Cyclobacteriaceae bacterium]